MTSEYQVCDHLTSVRYCQRFQLDSVDLGGGWLQVPAENGQLQPYLTTQIQGKASALLPRRLSCFYTSYNLLEKLSKDTAAVNALLAYSKGQLALAPCMSATTTTSGVAVRCRFRTASSSRPSGASPVLLASHATVLSNVHSTSFAPSTANNAGR